MGRCGMIVRARLFVMEEPTMVEAEDGWWSHKIVHGDGDDCDGETVGVVVLVRSEMAVVGMMVVMMGWGWADDGSNIVIDGGEGGGSYTDAG